MNYWTECVACALDEAGIKATADQIETIAGMVEGAHENYRTYTGEDCIPSPVAMERDKLAKELEREKRLVQCPECVGRGRITSYGPHHSCDSECWKCRGDGKIDPRK